MEDYKNAVKIKSEQRLNSELINAVRSRTTDYEGASVAFCLFYNRHAIELYNFLLTSKFVRNGKTMGSEDIATSLVTDVFTRIWEKGLPLGFTDMDDDDKLAGYLFIMAVNIFRRNKNDYYFKPKPKHNEGGSAWLGEGERKNEHSRRIKVFEKYSLSLPTREETVSHLDKLEHFIARLSDRDKDIWNTYFENDPQNGEHLPKEELTRLESAYGIDAGRINQRYHRIVDRAARRIIK